MIVEDQSEVIKFLSGAGAFGIGGDDVARIETHISIIFLTNDRVFKLKRAVKFPYLDFSTAGRRRAACEAEVAVNRRTAPGLYRGILAIKRASDGSLRLQGDGEPVDWLVEMARFDEDTLFDHLAQRGELDRHDMENLAGAIVRLHGIAEKRTDHGGRSGMAAIIDGNAKTFEEFAEGVLDPAEVKRLNDECRRLLDDSARFLDARRAAGLVRHCHGDLHLRNICIFDGEPTLFDAIEFSEELSNIDVLYDLAFLLMDLDHRDLRRLANIVLNRYLDITADTGGLKAMPLFLAVRAAIRSHVNAAMTATLDDGGDGEGRRQEARSYLSMALAYVSPPPARVVAVGGLSGSGKSRLGRELAPCMGAPPGARLARSDVLRKRLAGVPLLARLGAEGYTEEMTGRTYRELYEEARTALDAGYSVVADAVFAKLDQRQAIEAVAAEARVPFQGIWLEAPREIMEQRIRDRRQNVSDATAKVVRQQLAYDLGPLTWPRIDSSGPREDTLSQGLRLLAP